MCAAAIAHPCDLDTKLVTFLSGCPRVRNSLAADILKPVRCAAVALTRGPDAWMREEVVGQAFLMLLEAPHRFDPSRGRAKRFLPQIAREAARAVRSAYAPPGGPRRGGGVARVAVAMEDLGEDELLKLEPRAGSAVTIESWCDVIHAAARMPTKLALVFSRVAEGDAKQAIAAETGFKDRFHMERQMETFRRTLTTSRKVRAAA